MKPELVTLLLLSCACLAGLAFSAMLLFRDQRRATQQAMRINWVTSAYRPPRTNDISKSQGVSLKLQRATVTGQIANLLRYNPAHRAVYPVRPVVVLALASVVSIVAARSTVSFIGSPGWAAFPITCVLLCRSFYGWYENRLTSTLYRQFPDALAMIVRAVRVGLPTVEAMRGVARESPEPTAREFTAIVAATAIGVPLDDALREMAERNRLPEYRFFATALSLQGQTGGGLTETLENLADTIRKRVAAQIRGHAIAAEARMSSYILGALPLVTGGLLLVVNPGYMQILFIDPAGRNLLLAAVGLLFTGAWSMRTLIRKSLT